MEKASIIKIIYRKIYYGIVVPMYEKMRKVDFYENIPPAVKEHNQYMMTTLRMRYRLDRWFAQRKITHTDSIIDVGCGKGRMLHFLMRYNFHLIDGIEYDEKIANIARKNIESLYGKRKGAAARIHIMTGDATTFVGYEKYNYVYFFNSFKGELLRHFLSKLRESIERNPRELFLVYAHSHFGRSIVLEERFSVLEDYPNEDITIYTYVPYAN